MPDLREINMTYDANGNVASITPPGRPLHGFDYNAVDLENLYTPPNVAPPLVDTKTYFTYNLDKQVTEVLRPDAKKINMGYDTGGRLGTITLRENPADPMETKIYTYAYYIDDPANVGQIGNLQSITAPDGGSLTFSYDGSLLLSSTWGGTSPVTGSISRTYDNDFRITSRSVNGGNTISFGFDLDGLLTSAGSETLAYDLTNGLLTGTALWSDPVIEKGVSDNYTYSGFGEVASYTASYQPDNATPVDVKFQTTYVRDKLGRITQKTENVQSVAHTFDYTYNAAGYLVEVQRDSVVTATYTYDLNGNRENNGAVYDDQDRLTATSSASYTYTDNGELLTKTEGALVTSYTYDVLGNLLSVTLPSGTLIEYVIDASSRRVGKKVDGVLERKWLYKDGLNPIYEEAWDSVNAIWVQTRFVYASRGNVPDFLIRDGVTYRVISDHLGSPRLVIDTASGNVAQAIEYDDWGNILSDTYVGTVPLHPFGFAGGLYDADTKLIRFGARDYDPVTGRWTAKDPIRFDGDGTNLMGYVQNDPINLIDPVGLRPLTINEQTFLAGTFGTNLDYSGINISSTSQGRASNLLKGNIKIPIRFDYHNLDSFTQTGELNLADSKVASVLAHEAFHYWQKTHGIPVLLSGICLQIQKALGGDPYNYNPNINNPKAFLNYFKNANVEQQGQIVEDMVRDMLNGNNISKYSEIADYVKTYTYEY